MRTFRFYFAVLFPALLFSADKIGLSIDNLVIEATRVSIIIDSALTEKGSGYFKGVITSQTGSGSTTAGLTFSSPLVGTITRTTGESYRRDNGELPNFKRYYEITNIGSGMASPISAYYVDSGINDERNNLSPPYFIYRYADGWTKYGEGSTNVPIIAHQAFIPTGISDWVLSNDEFPIIIDMQSFTAVQYEKTVTIKWQTASEVNVAGYFVLWRNSSDSSYFRRNPNLIPAKGIASNGAHYIYLDIPDSCCQIYYKIAEISLDGHLSYSHSLLVHLFEFSDEIELPDHFDLLLNKPNPFNESTEINFLLPTPHIVRLEIYNLLGNKVLTLVNDWYHAGYHSVLWNGRNAEGEAVATGLYFCRIRAGSFDKFIKMSYIR